MNPQTEKLSPVPVWQDLVHDYLEVSALLKEPERDYLVDHLKRQDIDSSQLNLFPSFALNQHLIVICPKQKPLTCWFYFPGEQKIRKNRLVLETEGKGKFRKAELRSCMRWKKKKS